LAAPAAHGYIEMVVEESPTAGDTACLLKNPACKHGKILNSTNHCVKAATNLKKPIRIHLARQGGSMTRVAEKTD